jgi:hypothetical protein
LADLDDDGRPDLISGSYWPGDLYVFLGKGGGAFGPAGKLVDPTGANASAGGPWNNPGTPDQDALATSPRVVDWDFDGDYDLVVGNLLGHVVLLRNEGGPKTPKFVRKGPIRAGGDVLEVDRSDAAPSVEDWDGDGLWDLVVGGGSGAVVFFRNQGRVGAPRFAPGVELRRGRGDGRYEPGKEPEGPGLRVKPHVVDWNGDGALDLLLGDLAIPKGPRRTLTPQERARKNALLAERAEAAATIERLRDKCGGDFTRLRAEEQRAVDAATRRREAIAAELEPLLEGGGSGFVWVYLRKPARPSAGSR